MFTVKLSENMVGYLQYAKTHILEMKNMCIDKYTPN
jgi:hypothetical protein